jgi:hypothetical protein
MQLEQCVADLNACSLGNQSFNRTILLTARQFPQQRLNQDTPTKHTGRFRYPMGLTLYSLQCRGPEITSSEILLKPFRQLLAKSWSNRQRLY